MLPPFPRQALQVLRIIRGEVRKPMDPPEMKRCGYLAWIIVYYEGQVGCDIYFGPRCPVGLYHQIDDIRPLKDRCKVASIDCWLAWWEKIKEPDAQAALDFIWRKA